MRLMREKLVYVYRELSMYMYSNPALPWMTHTITNELIRLAHGYANIRYKTKENQENS